MTDATEPPRRFYKAVDVGTEAPFAVLLDGRRARTPAGAVLAAPTRALAALMAQEWAAQGAVIRTAAMPAVGLAFTALDLIPATREAVCAEVARHAGADLLCYFADQPKALEERQVQAWGPVLEWAAEELGLNLRRTVGIAHVEQPAESLARAAELAAALDDFALAGLAHATALFGSAALAFAVQRDKLAGEEAFALSRLDETFQAERWGVDPEAAERAEGIRGEAGMLEAWFRALRG